MPTTKKDRRPTHAVITLPDPDHFSARYHAEIGGTIEWRCETPDYPSFDITFVGKTPFNSSIIFPQHGTITAPVVLTVEFEGDFDYKITHCPAPVPGNPTGPTVETFAGIRTQPCKGCPP